MLATRRCCESLSAKSSIQECPILGCCAFAAPVESLKIVTAFRKVGLTFGLTVGVQGHTLGSTPISVEPVRDLAPLETNSPISMDRAREKLVLRTKWFWVMESDQQLTFRRSPFPFRRLTFSCRAGGEGDLVAWRKYGHACRAGCTNHGIPQWEH